MALDSDRGCWPEEGFSLKLGSCQLYPSPRPLRPGPQLFTAQASGASWVTGRRAHSEPPALLPQWVPLGVPAAHTRPQDGVGGGRPAPGRQGGRQRKPRRPVRALAVALRATPDLPPYPPLGADPAAPTRPRDSPGQAPTGGLAHLLLLPLGVDPRLMARGVKPEWKPCHWDAAVTPAPPHAALKLSLGFQPAGSMCSF